MADDDVGDALAGPFDKYLSPWDKMRRRTDIDDRQNEPWPTVNLESGEANLPQSLTMDNVLEVLAKRGRRTLPPDFGMPTRLGLQAGVNDINPPTKEELMNYLMLNESTGPDPRRPKVPLPRRRPTDVGS